MCQSDPLHVSVVWLGKTPFITIIAASVETYGKKCYGLLLGYRSWSHWDRPAEPLLSKRTSFKPQSVHVIL
ncbi:MAG: hypothetical protein QXO15_02055 [Nitrososphaerota archaeon]